MTAWTGTRAAAGIAGCALAIAVGGVAATPAVAAPASAPLSTAAAAAGSAAAQPAKCMSAKFCIYGAPRVVCQWPSAAFWTTRSGCAFIAAGRNVVRVVNHTPRRIAFYTKDGYGGRLLGKLTPGGAATLGCGCQVRSFRAVG